MVSKYFIAFVLGATVLGGTWLHGNHHGQISVQAELAEQSQRYQKRLRGLADKLDAAEKKRTEIVKEKVRTVYVEQDPTGCADTPALNSVYDNLRANSD